MNNPLIFLSTVLGLGIAAQWIAWRIKLPSILLLLGVGFLMGIFCGDNPDVPGATITEEILTNKLLFPLVSLAVAVIMFEGGLTLRFGELESSGSVVFRMVTIGVVVAWGLSAVACRYLIGMEPKIAALTGAILVVTGPTVIAPLLRHVRPARRIGSIVKWEGIVIDPVGAVLAVLTFEAVIHGEPSTVAIELLKIILIGTALGLSTAWILVQLLKRYWVPDFLHNSVFLAAAVSVFTLSNSIAHEAGLVTVTLLGIALANQKTVPVRHVVEFKENLRVLLISCLFIVLAARVQPNEILDLGFGGVAFLIVLVLVIRPISVFFATLKTGLTTRERIFLAFLAPRGIVAAAVSSVFALEVMEYFHGKPLPVGADQIAPLTFLVIVGTVAVYGLAAAPLARVLGLADSNPQGLLFAGAAPWVRKIAKAVQDEGIQVLLVDTNYHNVAAAKMEGLTARCASIVSEYMEELELGGIGRLLAMTPNDDLNRLATVEFEATFGRAQVFQLPPRGDSEKPRQATVQHFQGRLLFDKRMQHADFDFRFASGAKVKTTKITDEFTFEDFQARYSEHAVVLFVITETRQLQVITTESTVAPKAGQMVIAVVDDDED